MLMLKVIIVKNIPSLKHLFIFLTSIISYPVCGKMSSSMLTSILLINLDEVKNIQSQDNFTNRRSVIPVSTTTDDPESNEITLTNQLTGAEAKKTNSTLLNSIVTPFDASHLPPLETNQELTNSFKEAFSVNGSPSFTDLIESIQNLSSSKTSFDLSNTSFLSAMKSMISAYFEAGGQYDSQFDLPLALYSIVLPNVQQWGGTIGNWVKALAQSSTEAFVSAGKSTEDISYLSSSFADQTVNLIHYGGVSSDPINSTYDPKNADLTFVIHDLKLETVDIPLSEKLSDGTTFNPKKISIIQQLSIGLSQGYLNSLAFNDNSLGLTIDDIENFTKISDNSFPNKGLVEQNMISSFFDGLLNSSRRIENELFTYELINSSSNGFLLASTVATTSDPEYLDNNLHTISAEKISRQITQSLILNKSIDQNNVESYTVNTDWLQPDRLVESAAKGAAMGSQLATVLPKSMDYPNSWEIFTNSRREIAKAVAEGSSSGAINSSAWLSTIANENVSGETVLTSIDIEKISRSVSLGSMIGNTGLAIYYPTDQLVPIINFTAQGSAYGSLTASNLSDVSPDTTESILTSITRQTSLGSSLGASFEPTVLLNLRPDRNSRNEATIDHLTAASFGATFGAILGIKEKNVSILVSQRNNQPINNNIITEVKQAAKQGSIEGALAGAKIALGLDDVNQNTLQSKSAILKAINKANLRASSDSNSNTSANFLRTNSKDMLLLMKKFGINPRYTNPAKMYKRPVVVQIDEPPIDEEASDVISNASPL